MCGDGIVCPFHGWRFDGEGRLASVPRLDRTPPHMSARAWQVCERNGRIFVWHHASGAAPSFDVIGYRDDESAWTPWRSNSYRVRVHVQDLTENILDRAHFVTVHDMVPPDHEHFEVSFAGASMVVDQLMKVTAMSKTGVLVRSRTTTCGPGIAAVEVSQGPIEMLTYIAQTPVDDEITEVNLLFSMKRLPDPRATEMVSELNDRITNLQFAAGRPDLGTQDLPRAARAHTHRRARGEVPALVPAVLLGMEAGRARRARMTFWLTVDDVLCVRLSSLTGSACPRAGPTTTGGAFRRAGSRMGGGTHSSTRPDQRARGAGLRPSLARQRHNLGSTTHKEAAAAEIDQVADGSGTVETYAFS